MLIINNDNVDGLFLANMYLFIEYIYQIFKICSRC